VVTDERVGDEFVALNPPIGIVAAVPVISVTPVSPVSVNVVDANWPDPLSGSTPLLTLKLTLRSAKASVVISPVVLKP
jgi:hypothetical protein